MIKYTTFIIILFLIAFSCKERRREQKTLLKKWYFDFESPDVYGRGDVNAYEGRYYSHCDLDMMYGYGISTPIPDSLYNCYLRVKVRFFARINGRRFGQAVAISVQKGDKLNFWYLVDLSQGTFRKNKWFYVEDSIQFYVDKGALKDHDLKVFGLNTFKKSTLDIDNLSVELTKVDVSNN